MSVTPRMRFLRPFTTRFFNPISRRVVGRLPGFGIIGYVGRKTGRRYRTPMNVFRHGDDFVFALTYGADVNWVRNVLAAGEAELESRGRRTRLTHPALIHDPSRRLMPQPVRFFLGLMRVSDFLQMRPAPTTPSSERPSR
jgi:deazaflavin-dependent oxidoreductase (nitroreductase family)